MTETSPKPIVTTAPVPVNEVERLEALRRYNILDTPPEVEWHLLKLAKLIVGWLSDWNPT